MSATTRIEWVCATVDVPGGERVQALAIRPVKIGVASKANLWAKGTTLKVRFLDGETALQERVMEAAKDWFLDDVRLKVALARTGERAQIRISFESGAGCWSYVGTDCLGIHPSQPTMNLGWVTLETPKRDFWSVVLHEWGHALGLLHEHNHPEAKIEWNQAAVYTALEGAPNYWDRKTIEDNVFAKFAASDIITTDFDSESVMIYPVPSHWTTTGVSFMPSWKLSDGDAATIRRLYGQSAVAHTAP